MTGYAPAAALQDCTTDLFNARSLVRSQRCCSPGADPSLHIVYAYTHVDGPIVLCRYATPPRRLPVVSSLSSVVYSSLLAAPYTLFLA